MTHRPRVYKAGPDPTLPACWHWHCACGQSGNGVHGDVGTQRGCFLAALWHVRARYFAELPRGVTTSSYEAGQTKMFRYLESHS